MLRTADAPPARGTRTLSAVRPRVQWDQGVPIRADALVPQADGLWHVSAERGGRRDTGMLAAQSCSQRAGRELVPHTQVVLCSLGLSRAQKPPGGCLWWGERLCRSHPCFLGVSGILHHLPSRAIRACVSAQMCTHTCLVVNIQM